MCEKAVSFFPGHVWKSCVFFSLGMCGKAIFFSLGIDTAGIAFLKIGECWQFISQLCTYLRFMACVEATGSAIERNWGGHGEGRRRRQTGDENACVVVVGIWQVKRGDARWKWKLTAGSNSGFVWGGRYGVEGRVGQLLLQPRDMGGEVGSRLFQTCRLWGLKATEN